MKDGCADIHPRRVLMLGGIDDFWLAMKASSKKSGISISIPTPVTRTGMKTNPVVNEISVLYFPRVTLAEVLILVDLPLEYQ